MKNYILYICLGLFIIFPSCQDQLDINEDPDRLSRDNAALSSEIASGIIGVTGAQGSYYALIGGIWSQFWAQSLAANQYNNIDDYSMGTADYTGGWSNMYDALTDIRNAKAIALRDKNWNYYLIATTLEVYTSHILTDFYGDIPYSEANNPNILNPQFDDAKLVYDTMIDDLDDALGRDLDASSSPAPGLDDFIFSGDIEKWIQFANTLKLKIYLRQTEARPTIASDGITAMINANVTFLTTDAAVGLHTEVFKDDTNISNPLYETDRRQISSSSNLRASTTMHSFMTANSDARIDAFYGAGNSLDQGDYNSDASPGSVSIANISPLTPIYFISAAQSYFMQAEAMERYQGGTGAKELYDAGIKAAFDKNPIFDTETWITTAFEDADITPLINTGGVYEYPSTGTFDDKLEAIITQKWIASYPDNGYESFFEQLRTGYPTVSEVEQSNPAYVPGQFAYSINGTTGGIFPQRIVYPNLELSRNANAPDIIEITVPIWWNN